MWSHNLIMGLTNWVQQLSTMAIVEYNVPGGKFNQSLSLPQSHLHSVWIKSLAHTVYIHVDSNSFRWYLEGDTGRKKRNVTQ